MTLLCFRRLAHSARLYDLVQRLTGDRQLQMRLDFHARALPRGAAVVDLGGGTGLRSAWPARMRYVCLDLDLLKLQRFVSKNPSGLALAADATRCALKTHSVDVVLCSKVTHHLNDTELDAMLTETVRILKEGGFLILADAIRSDRWVARLLWRLDRGSHPRTADAIRLALPAAYEVTHWDRFRVAMFHDFVLCVARRTTAARARVV